MEHELHTTTTTGRWWQDRRFKCATTVISVLENVDGERRAFTGLTANTDTFQTGWIIYDFGKYDSVTTEDEARNELMRRYAIYKREAQHV